MNLPSMSRRAVPPAAFATAALALGVASPAHAVSGVSDSSVTAVSAQYAKSTPPPPPQQASAPSQTALPEDEQVTLPAVAEPDEGATPLPEDESAPIAQAAQEDNGGGGSDLPNTGLTIAALALLGLALLTGGVALRRTAARIPA
jgi:hypothetical protein